MRLDWTIEECQRRSLEALRVALSVRDKGLQCWRSNGKVELRSFQGAVVREIFDRFECQDVVSAEIYCAGGKTIMAATAAVPFLQAGKKIVFVSPKRDAFDHFENEFNRVLYPHGKPLPGVPTDAVSACRDSRGFAFPFTEQVHIVTPYDLVAPNAGENEKKAIEAALRDAGLVILDEVHRMPEDKEGDTVIIGKVEPIVRELAIAGAKVLTLTGTHFRADGKSPFGVDEPDIVRTCQDLILEGCLPNLYGFPVALDADGLKSVSKRPNFLSLKYSKEGRRRNLGQVAGIIEQIVEIEAASCGNLMPGGHAIFVSRQDDARDICRLLNDRLGWKAFIPYVSEEVANGCRQEVQDKLQDGRLLGYATVMMGAESISVTRLKYAHLVARITSPNKLMQAIGRVMRMPDASDPDLLAVKDKAVVVDYQVRKKKILKLAMGIRDIARIGGSRVGELSFGGAVFQLADSGLPDVKLSLEEYEGWLLQTGEGLTADEKKAMLLALPVGSPRPSRRFEAMLANALNNYVHDHLPRFGKGKSYDPVFDRAIRKRQPQWFEKEADRKKRALLAIPIGGPKPSSKEGSLGRALCRYTQKNGIAYDPVFDEAIRERQPQWFRSKGEKYKEELLGLSEGCARPKGRLGSALSRHTNQNNSAYDSGFDRAIRKKQPQWFFNSGKKKKAILAMSKGVEMPCNGTVLGRAVRSYTWMSSLGYDAEFDKAIRKKQPHWFPKKISVEEKKQELLAMPAGCEKPDRYRLCINNYTNQNNSAYDPEFDKAIRKKQPQWFDRYRERSERKRALLSMPSGSEKPVGKLWRSVTYYTQPSRKLYDAEFDRLIRKKQPQWWAS